MKVIKLDKQTYLPVKNIVNKLLSQFQDRDLNDKKILIVCEDNTRSTPVDQFFSTFLAQIVRHTQEITVLFALGTHRPMTKQEMLKKLGLKKAGGIKITNHNAFDTNQLVDVATVDGVSLKINKLVSENDIVITIGSVIPHRVMGFSGGGKILCPGIGNKEFIDYTHWKSNTYREGEIMAQINNPMREMMDLQAELIMSKFPNVRFVSTNFVSTEKGVVDVFVGSFKDSYLKAAQLSSKIFVRKVDKCNKILAVVDDKCVDFWQAAKAVYNCARILEDNGIIVVFGKFKEGISSTHGEDILKFGYSTPEIIQKLYDEKQLVNQVAASHMIRVSQHLKRVSIMLASENLNENICKRANLGYLHPNRIKEEEYDLVVYNPVDIVLEYS